MLQLLVPHRYGLRNILIGNILLQSLIIIADKNISRVLDKLVVCTALNVLAQELKTEMLVERLCREQSV